MFVMVVAEFRQILYLQLGETPARFVYRLGPARSRSSTTIAHSFKIYKNLSFVLLNDICLFTLFVK